MKTLYQKLTSAPFIIAGPCVIESKSLLFEIAEELVRLQRLFNIPIIFKASFDKANRTSIDAFRGPGLKKGIDLLAMVKEKYQLPITTDIHESYQAKPVAEIADILQIPAFLCRQTDLVVDIARVAEEKNKLIQVKKAQFLAPWDCKNIVSKICEVTKFNRVILCERGTSFGYNNLVVDMLGFEHLAQGGIPTSIDATHAVQLPGADPRTSGASTGGRRSGVSIIAKSAVAAGADGVFLEFHTDPDKALCDGPSCLALGDAKPLLNQLKQIRDIVTQDA